MWLSSLAVRFSSLLAVHGACCHAQARRIRDARGCCCQLWERHVGWSGWCEGLALQVVDVDEAPGGEACYAGDAADHEDLLASGEAGAGVGYVRVEDLGGLRVVVQLKGEGVVADGEDAAPELDAVGELDCDEVADAPLEHFYMHGAGVERPGAGVGEGWGEESRDEQSGRDALCQTREGAGVNRTTGSAGKAAAHGANQGLHGFLLSL